MTLGAGAARLRLIVWWPIFLRFSTSGRAFHSARNRLPLST
jgi:hypothetical protein